MARISNELQKKLWDAAVELWSHGDLGPSEYTMPVLGLVFLKYTDFQFTKLKKQLEKKKTKSSRRQISKDDFQEKGVLYLQEKAMYSYLMSLTEQDDVAKAIDTAMELIEKDNPTIKGVLPKNYGKLDKSVLLNLLKLFNNIETELDGDVFGEVYEYFLGNFHKTTGEKGGEYFTPTSIVKLIVEIIEPFHGKIFDPACGSGGMFVQSAEFVKSHKESPMSELSIHGQEKRSDIVNISKMNLAVHSLEGDIKTGNSYYNDIHKSLNQFDFVMANPPFNSKGIDKDRIKDDPRFPLGLPRANNGNYIWIQMFFSALNKIGRAGFVMANSASDAGASEKDIREKLIKAGVVDVVVTVASNFFHTVTLPVTLWFLDKDKVNTDRKDKVLFLDARKHYYDIDRRLREFTEEHLQFFGDIVRLYRGKKPEYLTNKFFKEHFPKGKYQDVKGLCKTATLGDIEEQDWSLNPGRYVGIKPLPPMPKKEFGGRMQKLEAGLKAYFKESEKLEKEILNNMKKLKF